MVEWNISQSIFEDTLILNSGEKNYEGIIKTGFDFPRIFISCIMQDYVDREKITQLLDTHYTIPQKR